MAESHGGYVFNFLKKLINCFPNSLSPFYDDQQRLSISVTLQPGKSLEVINEDNTVGLD